MLVKPLAFCLLMPGFHQGIDYRENKHSHFHHELGLRIQSNGWFKHVKTYWMILFDPCKFSAPIIGTNFFAGEYPSPTAAPAVPFPSSGAPALPPGFTLETPTVPPPAEVKHNEVRSNYATFSYTTYIDLYVNCIAIAQTISNHWQFSTI